MFWEVFKIFLSFHSKKSDVFDFLEELKGILGSESFDAGNDITLIQKISLMIENIQHRIL